MNESQKQNFEGGIIYPQKEWERFLELKGVTQETIKHVLHPKCSEDFKIEEVESVLRVCKDNESKEVAKDALRAIAIARNITTIIIEDVCDNHSNHKASEAVQQWIDVEKRMRGHHTMGDTLGECFAEMYEENDNIIQFPKK